MKISLLGNIVKNGGLLDGSAKNFELPLLL
jgi:hypothetical protein